MSEFFKSALGKVVSLLILFSLFGPVSVKAEDFPGYILKKLQQVKPITTEEIGLPKKVRLKEGNLNLSENGKFWFLNSGELNLAVEKESGLMCRLKSLNPVEADLLPATRNGLVIYIWNKQYQNYFEAGWLDWFGLFNRLAKSSLKKGVKEGKRYIQLNCLLKMDNQVYRDWAEAKVSYTLSEERLDIKIGVDYKKTDLSGFEIGTGHRFDQSVWTRQLYPGESGNTVYAFPVDTSPDAVQRYREVSWDSKNRVEDPTWMNFGPGEGPQVAAKATLRYFDAFWNNTVNVGTKDCPAGILHYPMGILEGKDRFFLWGYLDLNSFTILTPNLHNWIPSFTISPQGIKAGESYAFDFTCRVFPKPENTITDVYRWYAQNVYSSNSLTKGIVRMPKNLPHRTMNEGNISFYPAYPYSDQDKKNLSRIEEVNLKMKFTNLWWGGIEFQQYDETRPIVGTWYNCNGEKVNAEELKAEIKRLQSRGYTVNPYTRQLHASWGYHEDRPRYRKWIIRGRDGWPFNYFTGASPDTMSAPLRNVLMEKRELLGIKEKVEVVGYHADFGDEEHRKWYLEEYIKKPFDYYGFDGYSWDMGWDVHVGLSANYPDTGVHHGILRVQYDTYKWMKEKYPRAKMLMNMTAGTPSHLYMDAVTFESGTRTDKLSADTLKAWNTPVVNLYYAMQFSDKDTFIKAVMRNLSYGVTYSGRGTDMIEPDYEYQLQLQPVALFSAKANSIPWVTESHSLTIQPEGKMVTGSLWADKDYLLAASYNDEDIPIDVSIKLKKSILARYGQKGEKEFKFTLLSPDGKQKADNNFQKDFSSDKDTVSLRGRLGPKELLLVW